MGLVAELRRRNVLRMAVLYVLAAWVVMQVAGVLMDLGALPDAMGPWVLALLVVGFPIALVFSWLFEITPEGLTLEKDVPEGASITHITGRRMDFIVIAVLLAGLILLAYDKWWPRDPLELSIAVLPFDNMSADPEQEHFSDGISEEILNLLAQVESLKVIARHSSFSFKGKDVDIATIAEQMNVRHILEGSVRRSGERVRITAQLIDAKDSSHLWSEAYDRDYSAEDLFEIQSEIAHAITDRLRMTLTGDDEKHLVKRPTENTEAYAAYLLGRERLRNGKFADTADAVEQFSLAIELDPQFANAYAALAGACDAYDWRSRGKIKELCPSSPAGRLELARKALELDPRSAEAWISFGNAIWRLAVRNRESESQQWLHEKYNEALAAYERGLELNPTLVAGYFALARVLTWNELYADGPLAMAKAYQPGGRLESAADRGLEVDPLSIGLLGLKSWYLVYTLRKEEAEWHAHRIVEIAPESAGGYNAVAKWEWELNGRIDESIRWMSKAMEIDPQRPDPPQWIGLAYSALGDPDMALAYFELAKAITPTDNEQLQKALLVEQAVVRLVSGEYDVYQLAELPSVVDALKHAGRIGVFLGVLLDLATERPADALARLEAAWPECIGAVEIPDTHWGCPNEFIRVYQELGDHDAAQVLIDADVHRFQTIGSEWPDGFNYFSYAGKFATGGRTDLAFDLLEKIVWSGWRGDLNNKHLRYYLCCDVAFDAIRDHERFRAIVATIEADMAQQLENVREMQRRGEVPTLEEVKTLIASAQESG